MPGQFTWDILHKHCSPPPPAQHCPHWAFFSHEGHALCDQLYQQLKLVCSTSHWKWQQVSAHSVSSFQWHLITSAGAPTLSTGVFLSVFHFPSLPEQLEPVVKALLPFFHDYYDGLRPWHPVFLSPSAREREDLQPLRDHPQHWGQSTAIPELFSPKGSSWNHRTSSAFRLKGLSMSKYKDLLVRKGFQWDLDLTRENQRGSSSWTSGAVTAVSDTRTRAAEAGWILKSLGKLLSYPEVLPRNGPHF